jgi:hypothetical protein
LTGSTIALRSYQRYRQVLVNDNRPDVEVRRARETLGCPAAVADHLGRIGGRGSGVPAGLLSAALPAHQRTPQPQDVVAARDLFLRATAVYRIVGFPINRSPLSQEAWERGKAADEQRWPAARPTERPDRLFPVERHRVYQFRIYTLRTAEALREYATAHWPRHLTSLRAFGVPTHGIWTDHDTGAHRPAVPVPPR